MLRGIARKILFRSQTIQKHLLNDILVSQGIPLSGNLIKFGKECLPREKCSVQWGLRTTYCTIRLTEASLGRAAELRQVPVACKLGPN